MFVFEDQLSGPCVDFEDQTQEKGLREVGKGGGLDHCRSCGDSRNFEGTEK